MSKMFTEVLPVKLPEGTRAKLAEIAKSRYESSCAVARRAIMQEIEAERRRRKESEVAA
jgi:predicted transcriptional regulator